MAYANRAGRYQSVLAPYDAWATRKESTINFV